MNPFRGIGGKFSPGVLISWGDLTSKLLYAPSSEEGSSEHWLIPSWAPRPWRIASSKIREVSPLFPPKARPTIRTILWAATFQRAPNGRLVPTCGMKDCINPLHQEESMPIPAHLCQAFFQEALERGYLSLQCANEGQAVKHRADLHRWRAESRKEGITTYDNIILRIRPTEDFQSSLLVAEVDREASSFAKALSAATGKDFGAEEDHLDPKELLSPADFASFGGDN